MTPERFRRLKEIFLEVRLLPPERRPARVASACGADRELRDLLVDLLSAEDAASPVDEPALGAGFSLPAPTDLVSSTGGQRRIFFLGSLRLQDVIGDGGNAVVYRAEQSNPRRDVAVKVLYGVDPSPSAAARFRREAEALGRLHHVGIAQVYDCGVAETILGRQPFLAMELIDGRPITRYARDEALSAAACARLLAKVCDAVHHAHENEVIHLDLKPGNVLVDRQGEPKVIDFGHARIAASLDGDLGLGGTPPYMSPEQRVGSTAVGAAADVYALGVLGGELLDAAPDGDDRLRAVLARAASKRIDDRPVSAARLADRLRATVDSTTTRGRSAVTTTLAALAVVAAIAAFASWVTVTSRDATKDVAIDAEPRSEPNDTFDLDVRRDVIDALRGAAADRFSSVGDGVPSGDVAENDPELAVALREVLASFHYQAGDHARAEDEARAALEQARAVLGDHHPATLRLCSHLAVLSLERGRLEEAEALFEEVGRVDAGSAESGDLRDRSRLNLGLLRLQWGRFSEARELLAEVHDAVHAAAAEDPSSMPSQVHVLSACAIGEIDAVLGDERCVLPLLQQAAATSEQHFGREHPVTLTVTDRLGEHLADHGRGEEALLLLDANLACKARLLGMDHTVTLDTRSKRARAMFVAGRVEEGIEALLEVLELRRARSGRSHPDAIVAGHHAGELLAQAIRTDEAVALFDEVLAESRASLPEGHWLIAMVCRAYGQSLVRFGRFDAGETLLKEAIARFVDLGAGGTERRIGGLDVMLLRSRTHLAECWFEQGRLAAAAALSREIWRRYQDALGEAPLTLQAAENHAVILGRMGRLAEAEQLLLRVNEGLLLAFGELARADLRVLRTHINLAVVIERQGRFDEALDLYRTVRRWCEAGAETPGGAGLIQRRLPDVLRQMSICETRAGRADRGLELAREALRQHQELFGDDHHGDIEYRTHLAFALIESGASREAEPILRECHAELGSRLGPRHPQVLRIENNLATALDHLGEHGALELWESALEGRRESLGEDHPHTLITQNNYARHLMDHGELDRSVVIFEDLCERGERACGDDSYELAVYRRNLGECLMKVGRFGAARVVLQEAASSLEATCGPSHATARAARRLLEQLADLSAPVDEESQASGSDS